MERAGGMAIVHSDVGEGTEIEISIARRAPAPPMDGTGFSADGMPHREDGQTS
jgi:hypothetical protein